MGRGKGEINPIILKIGLAFAFSIGGMLFSFIRNKRIKPKPPQSPSDSSKSSASRKESLITANSFQFDPLATHKHEELLSSNSEKDKDTYLLPEFNDLLKDFDMTAMKTELPMTKNTQEQEIKNLRNMVKTLKERERNLETQLLEYYGLKEQETAVMELKNRLKLNTMEAKLFALKIESLQADNNRLEAQMADYTKVLADLEDAKAKIKVLKRKLRLESAQNKEKILDLQQRVEKMQEGEHEQKGVLGVDQEVRFNLRKMKELEFEAEELRKSNYNLELEKNELAQKLEDVQIHASSVLEGEDGEKLKEESQRLKKQNEDLKKEIEQLQSEKCGDIEELVYLRWINACLRYELRNYKPGPGETMARDLSKTLSPKSEEKAKQLILDYANKEDVPEKGINFHELDSDQWSSSQASSTTDESLIEYSSNGKPSNNNKFFGKLLKFLRKKDENTPHHENEQHRRNSKSRHSKNSSLDDTSSYSDFLSFRNLASSSKHSMDSIAEGGGGVSNGGGGDTPCSSSGEKSEIVKYAEVLKDSNLKPITKVRRRSTLFSSF